VNGKTLDALVADLKLDRVDVVKVDIEGAEMDALRSADHIMRNFRPAFVLEYGMNTWPVFGATADDLRELAADRGYIVKIYDLASGRPVDPPRETWSSGYANLLLLPREWVSR
jgi:hypothetical protein